MIPSSLQREAAQVTGQDFYLGDCLVEPKLNRISCRGEVVRVELKVMQVLVCLARAEGQPVSKDELLAAVWPDTFVADHVLPHVVWQLRKVLKDDGLIETVPKRGYRLTGAVNPVPPKGKENAGEGKGHEKSWPVARFAILAGLFAGLSAAVIWWVGAKSKAEVTEPIHSIAIVALQSNSQGDAEIPLATGITGDLIEEMRKVQGLRLARVPDSVRHRGATERSWAEIAKDMKVDAILHGTVSFPDDRIKIALELWDARLARPVWSDTHERTLGDAFIAFGEIARAVATASGVTVSDAESVQLANKTVVAAAYRELLKAQALKAVAELDNVDQYVEHCRKAVGIDPRLAVAHTRLALVLGLRAQVKDEERDRFEQEALAEAIKGVELAPQSAWAHGALATVAGTYFWDWNKASEEFRIAHQLNPNHPDMLARYTEFLTYTGRCDEAIRVNKELQAFDPTNTSFGFFEQWIYFECGDAKKSIEAGLRNLGRDRSVRRTHYFLAYADALDGRAEEALRECIQGAASGVCEEPWILAVSGRESDARAVLKRWEQDHSKTGYQLALGYAGLGENDRAMSWLEQAYEAKDPAMRGIITPEFKSLLKERRFQELMCKMNLPPGTCSRAVALH